MGVGATLICTISSEEMGTGRQSLGGRDVRKITIVASWAVATTKEGHTHGCFRAIMDATAILSLETSS